MLRKILFFALLLIGRVGSAQTGDYFNAPFGELLTGSTEKVGLWWTSSGWKISRDKSLPIEESKAIIIKAARNEAEAAQLVVRPTVSLRGFTVQAGDLSGPGGAVISSESIEILKVRYVNVERPTDKSSVAGYWPDPLPPLKGPMDLEQNKNQPFWIRITVPQSVPAGIYSGVIKLSAQNYSAEVVLHVEVYDFVLPDRMTCTTAFGFSAANVFSYQKLSDPEHKRQVLDKYWANYSAHHISPYDPAPLDRIRVTWPDVKPPVFDKFANWDELRIVQNETHSGSGALLAYDDDRVISVSMYEIILFRWYRQLWPAHSV